MYPTDKELHTRLTVAAICTVAGLLVGIIIGCSFALYLLN